MTNSTKTYWTTLKPSNDLVENVQSILQCSELSAKLLINRNIHSISDIKTFFSSDLKHITPPWKIKDIEKACSRILQAINNNEHIMIFGDYDVDGVTSVSLLYMFLKPYTKKLSFYIPHREKEGYGFAVHHVNKFKEQNVNLIITVDCGSSDDKAISLAKSYGIETIVTDHHKILSIPQKAAAVINPHRQDDTSNLTHLAGVGVAFYLVIQLRKTLRENNFFKNQKEPSLAQFMDLVALGTIADIVPMVKENRIFTKSGLNIIQKRPRPAIKELVKSAKLNISKLTSQDIAFSIAPRINSAGRLEHAKICVDLLCSREPLKIERICSSLDKLNNLRKVKENEIVDEITKEKNLLQNKIIISQSEKWPAGILGTAASKITKKFNRPCILFSKNGSQLKGSARSIDGFSIYELIKSSKDLLTAFGGHTQAAGLSLDEQNFSTFCSQAFDYAKNNIEAHMLTKIHEAEDVIIFDDLTPNFFKELTMFEPFGVLNPYPVFISKNLKVESNITIKKIHSMLRLYQPNCIKQNRLSGFIFNNNNFVPEHLKQILLKPMPDKYKENIFNLFIEAWE